MSRRPPACNDRASRPRRRLLCREQSNADAARLVVVHPRAAQHQQVRPFRARRADGRFERRERRGGEDAWPQPIHRVRIRARRGEAAGPLPWSRSAAASDGVNGPPCQNGGDPPAAAVATIAAADGHGSQGRKRACHQQCANQQRRAGRFRTRQIDPTIRNNLRRTRDRPTSARTRG